MIPEVKMERVGGGEGAAPALPLVRAGQVAMDTAAFSVARPPPKHTSARLAKNHTWTATAMPY
jgi:hypothetical protein